jgi:DNA polymerase III subunit alpha
MFTHLHCHSHFSLLDGLSKIDELVGAAQERGMTALALTDHGVLYGAIEFYNQCHERGIKPIIGMEAYIAPRSMQEKDGKVDAGYFHLTLLAKTYQGYLNLMKISTIAHIEGFYYKPRIDKATLAKYTEGIIALSGCQRGEIARASLRSPQEADRVLAEYVSMFGADNFFIEVQRNSTRNHAEQDTLNNELVALARRNHIGLVATQDSHYISPSDAEAQDVMVCIGTGKTVDDPNRLDMRDHDLSLRDPETMAQLFVDIPEAITNTQLIADQCNVEIPINQRYFAHVKLPPGVTAEQHLEKLVREQGLRIYGKDDVLSPEVTDRISYELDIINQKGFAVYFLMLADIVQAAHEIGAITNTRGSAAGSIVSRVLGISDIDPLYYQLPFERFLNLFRPTPPDIDLDISDNRRNEVIEWITENYGRDKVAQIITFGTMMARAAVRDVGRALGIAYSKCDRIAKMIPLGKQGFHMTLDKALGMNQELREIYEQDPDTKKILDIARRLEGCARHASIHAAALAITPTPLTDYTPLQKEPDGDRLITQYDMYALDAGADSHAIGVVKLDLLGIRNLSILEEAVKIVQRRHSHKVDIYNLPHPDEKTFKLLGDGLTFGVFQLGSSGMTRYLKELRPKSIFDIMAMIALYRPGPMGIIPEYINRNHHKAKIEYFDPRMKDYLERSLGLLVYQDDVLLTAINIAGYTWEEADGLRKAMGKKIPAEMAKQKVKFIEGCVNGGMTPERAGKLFSLIEPFAAYGFGKAHAASYGMVSYQTAYMKANFPVEFMAAVMTAESGDEDKIYAAVEECKNLAIAVLPPDVEESWDHFTVIDDHTIRFGLNGIKNLGSDVVRQIIDCHKNDLAFPNLEDFLTHCYTKNFNKKSWEALVKSGALDRYGERGQLLASTESVLDFLREHFRSDSIGQDSLFGKSLQIGKLRLKDSLPATDDEKLAWEKEHLGLYVSAHPLDHYQQVLNSFMRIKELSEDSIGRTITLGGIISKFKRTLTKKNDPMAFFTLEDFSGNVEVLVFPTVMMSALPFIGPEKIVQVTGRLSDKDGEFKLIAEQIQVLPNDELYLLALAEMEKSKQVVIHLNVTSDKTEVLNKIKDIIEHNPGNAQVYLNVSSGLTPKLIKTQAQVRVSNALIAALKAMPEVLQVSEK